MNFSLIVNTWCRVDNIGTKWKWLIKTYIFGDLTKCLISIGVYIEMERKYGHAWELTWQVSADESIYRDPQGFSQGLATELDKLISLCV